VLPSDLAAEIDLGTFALPPVFEWLMAEARLDRNEMLRTFNCGIGMVLIVSRDDAERVRQHLEEAKAVGTIVKQGSGDAVRYKGARAWDGL
jgi:phosphoribosylformylglycinamidine cyclo-ligase